MHLSYEFKVLSYSESFLKQPAYCLLKKVCVKMGFTLKMNYVTIFLNFYFNQFQSIFHLSFISFTLY